MKIALFGSSMKNLMGDQTSMCQMSGNGEGDNRLDYYTDIELLKENLCMHDLIFMNEEIIKQIQMEPRHKVAFSWGKKLISCFVDEIYYVEAELKDVHIYQHFGEFMVHMPFSKVEALLSSEHFLKIHRSYLVNCEYVAGIENGQLTLKNGRTLPVSKYRINEVMNNYLSYIESCNLE